MRRSEHRERPMASSPDARRANSSQLAMVGTDHPNRITGPHHAPRQSNRSSRPPPARATRMESPRLRQQHNPTSANPRPVEVMDQSPEKTSRRMFLFRLGIVIN